MWLQSSLERRRRRTPAAAALVDSRRTLTWAQLHDEVHAFASHLVELTDPGDRVAILSANRIEVIVAYYACSLAGVLACPLNPAYTSAELAYVLDGLTPAVALVDADSASRVPHSVRAIPVESVASLVPRDPMRLRSLVLDAPAMILQTSATTGYPKGVVVDQRSLQANALSWFDDFRPVEGTRFLQAGPLFHGSLVIALDYLAAGCPVHIMDRFTPQGCIADLVKWGIEETFLVPSMLRLLLDSRAVANADLPYLKRIGHGAAPMPQALARRAIDTLGIELHNVYGITEGGGPVLGLSSRVAIEDASVPGATCVGLPMAGVCARIVDERGAELASGEIGSVQLAGDGLMRGYWHDPAATASTLRDGWLITGDLGYRDASGYLWLVDRRTDLILRGGQNVYPAEIERVLIADPAVADVAVVAAPDDIWGQTPLAFVQVAEGEVLDTKRLVRRCVEELSSYKRPSGFRVIEAIPRNPAGKILRRNLRDLASGELNHDA